MSSSSYYYTVDGIDYDKKLLDSVTSYMEGKGDGRISIHDAKKIVKSLRDGGAVTAIELRTAFRILHTFWDKFTPKGRLTFVEALSTIELK